jgi:hypothetical protein
VGNLVDLAWIVVYWTGVILGIAAIVLLIGISCVALAYGGGMM